MKSTLYIFIINLFIKCTTDSCTAAFCEKGELLAHQTNHGEQKRITCNHKLSGTNRPPVIVWASLCLTGTNEC
jgi:hypothetical protein